MTTTERGTPSTWPPSRRPPLRLRRLAVLRVLLRPRTAAQLLAVLADESRTRDLMIHAALRACAIAHYGPRQS